MKLSIFSIENKGDLAQEVLWLEAKDACDLSSYIVIDTTFTESGNVSNKLRRVFWFPPTTVSKGDLIALRTTVGRQQNGPNSRKTITHTFFWNLQETTWNKDGDCAVLIEISNSIHHPA